MSRRMALVLEADALQVVGAPGLPRLVTELAHPGRMVSALRAVVPRGADAVLVLGMGVLEAAEPALPPVPPPLRVPLVRRESDRFLPLPSGAGVTLAGPLALGMDGALLDRWVDAVREVLPVVGVVTLPQCAAWAGADGHWQCPAGTGEVAEVVVREGALVAVRRRRAGDTTAAAPLPALPVTAVVEAMRRRRVPSLEEQLLTPALLRQLTARQRRGWWQSAAVAACALGALAGGFTAHQTRTLARLEARERELVTALEPARTALGRVERARQELIVLEALAAQASAPTAPLPVLATLGERLPADAVVDRLEWDGERWRLDGSARDAAGLVPRLAADARFREVRSAAPSQQFVEQGTTRRSFSITLRVVANGAPDTAAGVAGRGGRTP